MPSAELALPIFVHQPISVAGLGCVMLLHHVMAQETPHQPRRTKRLSCMAVHRFYTQRKTIPLQPYLQEAHSCA